MSRFAVILPRCLRVLEPYHRQSLVQMVARGVCVVLALVTLVRHASAEQNGSNHRSGLPDDMVIIARLDNPCALVQNRFLLSIGKSLALNPESANLFEPEIQRQAEQAIRLVEESLKTDWMSALKKLTAGGVVLAIRPPLDHGSATSQSGPPEVLLIVSSDESDTVTRFLSTIREAISRRRAEAVVTHIHGNQTYFQTGDAYYLSIDHQLVASNKKQLLIQHLDRRLVDGTNTQSKNEQMGDKNGDQPAFPRFVVEVSLEWFRNLPDVAKALVIPSSEPGSQLILGGYLDLLRRGNWLTLSLGFDHSGCDAEVSIDAGSSNRPEIWAGFFADGETAKALPLLMVPGTIVSMSWFRDIGRLWDARSDWGEERSIARLEKQNKNEPIPVVNRGMIDCLIPLGSTFRFVIVQPENATESERSWPAIGVICGLKEPAHFRKVFYLPVVSQLRLLAPAFSASVDVAQSTDGNETATLRFQFDKESDIAQSLADFASPSFAINHDQLVICSSKLLTDQLLQAIGNEANAVDRQTTHGRSPTDEFYVSFKAIVTLVRSFERELIETSSRERGVTKEAVHNELSIFYRLFDQLDAFRGKMVMHDSKTTLSARIGGEVEAAGSKQ